MSRKVLRRACTIILGVLFFAGLTNQCFAIRDEELFGAYTGLLISAETDKMIYQLDDEVTVTVFLKNKTEEPIEIVEPAIDKKSFLFEIILPDGKKDNMLSISGMNLRIIRLYPKKRVKFTTKFLPEMPGNYDINVKYNGYSEPLVFPAIRVFVVGNLPQKDISLIE